MQQTRPPAVELLQLCGIRHADEAEGAAPEDGIDLRSDSSFFERRLLAENQHIDSATTKETGKLAGDSSLRDVHLESQSKSSVQAMSRSQASAVSSPIGAFDRRASEATLH